jgi:hypothetical protein
MHKAESIIIEAKNLAEKMILTELVYEFQHTNLLPLLNLKTQIHLC